MTRNLLSLLVAGALSMGVGVAQAEPFYMDVGAAGGAGIGAPFGDANTRTAAFDSFQLFANTTSIQYDTNASASLNIGDRFIDSGHANFTSGLPAGDQEGINQNFGLGVIGELTIAWSGLSGTITSLAPKSNPADGFTTITTYDAGTLFEFYYQEPGNLSYGATVFQGDDSGHTDGVKVLTLEITSGIGSNSFSAAGIFQTGSSNLQGKVVYALDDFWHFSSDGADWEDLLAMTLPITLVQSEVDQNTNHVVNDFSNAGAAGPAGFGIEMFRVGSDHDGSIEFSRTTVPEPATLALLGLGLLGLSLSRRKSA